MIEAEEARRIVEENRQVELLLLDVIENVNSLQEIGWRRYYCKQTMLYYPAIVILTKKCKWHEELTRKIQYIGVVWKKAMEIEFATFSAWITYNNITMTMTIITSMAMAMVAPQPTVTSPTEKLPNYQSRPQSCRQRSCQSIIPQPTRRSNVHHSTDVLRLFCHVSKVIVIPVRH